MIDFTRYDDALLDKAAAHYDLNAGLKTVFDVIDPQNQYDLGGHAGNWFSIDIEYVAPMDNLLTTAPADEAWWHLDQDDRRRRLHAFFSFMRRAY